MKQLQILRNCIKINQFKAHLIILARVVDSKLLTMAIQLNIFNDKKTKWQM